MVRAAPETPDGVKTTRLGVLKLVRFNGLKVPREIRGRGFPRTEYLSARKILRPPNPADETVTPVAGAVSSLCSRELDLLCALAVM